MSETRTCCRCFLLPCISCSGRCLNKAGLTTSTDWAHLLLLPPGARHTGWAGCSSSSGSQPVPVVGAVPKQAMSAAAPPLQLCMQRHTCAHSCGSWAATVVVADQSIGDDNLPPSRCCPGGWQASCFAALKLTIAAPVLACCAPAPVLLQGAAHHLGRLAAAQRVPQCASMCQEGRGGEVAKRCGNVCTSCSIRLELDVS